MSLVISNNGQYTQEFSDFLISITPHIVSMRNELTEWLRVQNTTPADRKLAAFILWYRCDFPLDVWIDTVAGED